MADLPMWVPPPLAAYGDILRAAAHVCDVAERERLARIAQMPIADIRAWAERHDIVGSDIDLRCAFEDARTLNPSGVSASDSRTNRSAAPDA